MKEQEVFQMADNSFLKSDDLDSLLEGAYVDDELSCMENDMRHLLMCFDSNIQYKNSEISDKFIEYFKNYDRLLYSTITPYLTNFNKPELRDNYLQRISQYYQSNEAQKLPKDVKIKVLKLYDHVNLVIHQNAAFYTPKRRIQKICEDSLIEAKKEIKDQVQNVNTQLISIVSIFVAISFVMFGGMSLLNNLFDYSGLNRIPLLEMLCGGSLIGLIIVAVMYAFMMLVLKITNHEIGDGKNTLYKNTVSFASWSLLIIFIVTFGMWVANFHSSNDFINEKKSYQTHCKTIEYNKKTKEVTLVCPADFSDKGNKK